MAKRKVKKKESFGLLIVAIIFVILTNYDTELKELIYGEEEEVVVSYKIEEVPEYNGENYVYINDNKAEFDDADKLTQSFEIYNSLDELGRATYAYANVSIDTFPDEKRGSLSYKPTGWHISKYSFIDGKYLYNRCHLIGYQLTGENDNEKNLITCTRQMNVEGMLEFENKVASYVKETENHVLYRVIPYYDGDNLVATGVHMEAYSVEDEGEGINFSVFVYNVQDGVKIDYSNGDNEKEN